MTLYLCVMLVIWRTSTIDSLAFKLATSSSLPLFAFLRYIISTTCKKDKTEAIGDDTQGNTVEGTQGNTVEDTQGNTVEDTQGNTEVRAGEETRF